MCAATRGGGSPPSARILAWPAQAAAPVRHPGAGEKLLGLPGRVASAGPGEYCRALGVGVIWWPELDPLCHPAEGLVDVIEAEPEAFWTRQGGEGPCRSALTEALAHLPQPKLLHGVGAPLGGTCRAPDWHLRLLRADMAALDVPYVSEHLSFNHFQPRPGQPDVFTNALMPPLQSAEGAALAAAGIVARRAALGGVRLAVETPVSYLPMAPGEWPDGAYVATVARLADCGIVLDLHNILCNARNGRQDIESFLAELPLDRVWELHLGGGEALDGVWLDAHAGVPEADVMDLAASLVPVLPALQSIIFEITPQRVTGLTLHQIAAMLGRLKDIWETRGQDVAPPSVPQPVTEPACSPQEWEALLGFAATGFGSPSVPAGLREWWAQSEQRLTLYRRLSREGRASAVAAAAPNAARTLIEYYGPTRARQMLAAYWRSTPAAPLAIDEAKHCLDYLSCHATMPVAMARAIAADAFAWGG